MFLRHLFSLTALATVLVQAQDFDPYSYTKKNVTRSTLNHATGETVDIQLCKLNFPTSGTIVFSIVRSFAAFVEINPSAKSTLLLVHGWPGLWTTWSRQIAEFEVTSAHWNHPARAKSLLIEGLPPRHPRPTWLL